MEDRLQISQAQEEENAIVRATPVVDIVRYNAKEESLSFLSATTSTSDIETAEEQSESDMQETDPSETKYGYSKDPDTVALIKRTTRKDKDGMFYKLCMSCRSPDPELKVTPFAVILLGVLFVVYILNQADRLMLPVAIPSGLRCKLSVKSECRGNISEENTSNDSNQTDCIHFNDNEQGLLTGPAFTVIYVIAGLPLARLADTRSRSLVLLIGIVFWSAMVFLTGFVKTFWQLLVLRIFLGIGEAACNPVAYSLIADFYPSRHRAFALSVYHYGVYVGGGLGWMIGYVNEVLGWQWTFRILGICGFIVTPIAMLALWEPKTIHEKRMSRISGKKTYSIKEVALFLVKCPPYWMLLIAGSIRNIPGYALGAWLPTFYTRRYGLSPQDYSIIIGIVVLFGGGLGSFLGGFVSDRLSAYWKNAKAYVIAVSQVLAAPAIAGVLLAPTPHVSYGLLFVAYVTAETWLGPAAAIVQDLCMPAMRAQASAIYIGIITIVASLGPVIVPGIMNHATFLDPCTNGVGYSLLMVAPSFYLLSAVLFTVLGIMIVTWTTCAHKSATVQDITSITEPLQNHTEHEVSDFVPHEKT